jgi:hypothetical protein
MIKMKGLCVCFMDGLEVFMLIISAVFAIIFLAKWYSPLTGVFPKGRCRAARVTLGFLPLVSIGIISATLTTLAAPSVIGEPLWIFFYLIMGFLWIYSGMGMIFRCFDLSWRDDVVNKPGNQPALLPVIGSFVAISLIYSGANIGDGPGFWCVIYAGGMGLLLWLLFGHILQKSTDAFGTITIGRNLPCAMRTCAYLIASGIILGHASSGDSISFETDVVEIAITAIPALPLMLLAIFVERHYINKKRNDSMNSFRGRYTSDLGDGTDNSCKFIATIWCAIYIGLALAAIPLNDYVLERARESLWAQI